jgi:hypothetical protein
VCCLKKIRRASVSVFVPSFSVFVPLALTCHNSYILRPVEHGDLGRAVTKLARGFDGRDLSPPLAVPALH